MFHSFFLFFVLVVTNAFAVDWQGHRGARGLYPENTIGSMEEALKYPVTTLELDVVVSKDHKVVVSHEPWMNEDICLDPQGKRIKGKSVNLYQLTYQEIQKYDCGSLVHPRFPEQQKVSVGKPQLDTLIDNLEISLKRLNRRNVEYNIEIKSLPQDEKEGFQPDIPTFSDLVINVVQKKLPDSKFTIQSFDWRVLQYIHKKYPSIRLVALKEENVNPEEDLKVLGFKPYVYSPYFKSISANQVKFLHQNGIKVVVWTLNTISEMEQMLGMNVDGIITDYPNLITQIGAKKCKSDHNLFEKKCVKVPSHALPSDANPGWLCKPGYVQKRNKCFKMNIPKGADLLPDGKSWECRPGFERYRGTCKKK